MIHFTESREINNKDHLINEDRRSEIGKGKIYVVTFKFLNKSPFLHILEYSFVKL